MVVVLPSPGTEEVTITTCGRRSTLESSTEVRRLRTASASAEDGFSTSSLSAAPRRREGASGITPITFSPVAASSGSGPRTRSSSVSRARAQPTPAISPRAAATASVSPLRGEAGSSEH